MNGGAMLLVCLTVLCVVRLSLQHGYLIDPPSRSSLWRVNSKAPPNYNDNRLYCGGRSKIQQLGGLCGPCGDPYDGKRENEAGGKYALGIISKHLPDGADVMETKVVTTAFHKGYYEFRICVNNDVTKPVTQECLNENLMTIVEGDGKFPTRFYPQGPGEHLVHVNLPKGIKCSQCVVQWRYRTGNSWGRDLDGTECIGCGVQEEFRNCADISIGSGDDKDRKQHKNHQESVDPLVTENSPNPRFRGLGSFTSNSQRRTTPPTAAPTVRSTPQAEPPMINHLWTKTEFLKPRISIDMNRRQERPSTPKPAPRISFLDSEPETTENPIFERMTTRSSNEARLIQLQKLQRLAALAIQMKNLLNTLRHLPVFQSLNLGVLDREVLGQKEAPWNNLAKPAVTKKPSQTRSFPWESGMSLSEIKSTSTSSSSSNSAAHILRIPASGVRSKFNYPILPPPSPFLTSQFRREKTRTVTLGSDNTGETTIEAPAAQKEGKENIDTYQNEFNVISPESLEGEISIKDWYKKIVKLMVQKKMPVAEIKKMVDRLKQIKDVHKTQPMTMLEKLQNSQKSVVETTIEKTEFSDNSLSTMSTASSTTNMVYPEMERKQQLAVERKTVEVSADPTRNMVYPEAHREQQRARDISAIPPNINTVREHPEPQSPSINNPYVDYSEDNRLTPEERRPLASKLRNFLELNPQFSVPFGAVFH